MFEQRRAKWVADLGYKYCAVKVGRTGQKIHLGTLDMWVGDDKKIHETLHPSYCGSVKVPFGNFASNGVKEGVVKITCKKCGEREVNLDELNVEKIKEIEKNIKKFKESGLLD